MTLASTVEEALAQLLEGELEGTDPPRLERAHDQLQVTPRRVDRDLGLGDDVLLGALDGLQQQLRDVQHLDVDAVVTDFDARRREAVEGAPVGLEPVVADAQTVGHAAQVENVSGQHQAASSPAAPIVPGA